jgi:hypothetical protein
VTQSTAATVYHRTSHAIEILSAGFRDGATYLPEWFEARRGVWVSLNFPLTPDEGAHGDNVIVMSIPMALFEKYEAREERKPYREAMIPASELNKYLASARLLSRHEQDELAEAEVGHSGPSLDWVASTPPASREARMEQRCWELQLAADDLDVLAAAAHAVAANFEVNEERYRGGVVRPSEEELFAG